MMSISERTTERSRKDFTNLRRVLSILAVVSMTSVVTLAQPTPKPCRILPPAPEAVRHHPFLLVTEPEYEPLRERARKEPWKSMKRGAISYVRENKYKPHHWSRIWKMDNKGALAYILDPANQSEYLEKIQH